MKKENTTNNASADKDMSTEEVLEFAKNAEEVKPSTEPTEAVQPEQDFKKFEYGDVYFECNRCGNISLVDRGVKDGLQFTLPSTDKHEWRFVCQSCKNMMRIFFKESTEETIKEKHAE